MPTTAWRDSIHRRVSSALTRLSNPLGSVKWQSQDFIGEACAAAYVQRIDDAVYLTGNGISLWFEVNPRTDPDRDRRRDLVAYAEVLSEFGPEIANREARPPLEHRQRVDAAVAKLLDSVGYQHDAGRPA
jgi:hypothetical protein